MCCQNRKVHIDSWDFRKRVALEMTKFQTNIWEIQLIMWVHGIMPVETLFLFYPVVRSCAFVIYYVEAYKVVLISQDSLSPQTMSTRLAICCLTSWSDISVITN
ncbi:hypothetical protein GmHk_20G059125 [Glycine max]|nr:hypothetical protein GmHk_20G059125 [Glycine max]